MKSKTKIGLVSCSCMIILTRYIDIPFLSGAFAGMTICFLVLGLLPQKVAESIKNWKRIVLRHQ